MNPVTTTAVHISICITFDAVGDSHVDKGEQAAVHQERLPM